MAFGTKKDAASAAKGVPFFKSRKFKYGSVSTGLTIAFIAVVIIINVIFSLLADHFSWKLDMTSYNLYSISDTSRETVNALTKENKIDITVVYNEEDFPQQLTETIKRFAALSSNVNYKFVDPVVNPSILTSFGEEFTITEGSAIIENGNRRRVITPDNMLEQNEETGAITYKMEEALVSALLYVTKDEIPKTYFITGHGEAGYEALMGLIANNGADAEEVQLNQLEKFDDLARVMVICGPMRDYSEKEIRQLQEFISNDYNYERDIFYFANPEAPAMPNLEAFLADWEIKVEKNIILESAGHSVSNDATSTATVPLYLLPSYTDSEVSGITIQPEYQSIVPNASAVSIIANDKDMTETVALMTTSEESYAKSLESINDGYGKTKGDESGPFNVAVIATRYRYNQSNVAIESHIFAAGSVDMLNKDYVSYSGNGDFLLDVYQMMVGEYDTGMQESSKTSNSPYLMLNTQTQTIWSIIFILVIPVIFLIIGAIVYIRRRFL